MGRHGFFFNSGLRLTESFIQSVCNYHDISHYKKKFFFVMLEAKAVVLAILKWEMPACFR
jgi:hypothetical protein